LFAHDSTGVSWQKLEHVHPEALLPRQATLWNGAGTYWHQAGTEAAACPERLLTGAGMFCGAWHPQQSGLLHHDSTIVCRQELEHVQLELVFPRQTALWNGVGTY